jgi:hypothetical protein
MTADPGGFLQSGLFRPALSQLALLAAHPKREHKDDDCGQENGDAEQQDLLPVTLSMTGGIKRIHVLILAFPAAELS